MLGVTGLRLGSPFPGSCASCVAQPRRRGFGTDSQSRAVLHDEHFQQVGERAMVSFGSCAKQFLHSRSHAQIDDLSLPLFDDHICRYTLSLQCTHCIQQPSSCKADGDVRLGGLQRAAGACWRNSSSVALDRRLAGDGLRGVPIDVRGWPARPACLLWRQSHAQTYASRPLIL